MTPCRAEGRKSTKTSPRRRPKRKTAASDTRAERCRTPSGNSARPHAFKARREAIDDEFRQRRVAAVELVRFVHGGRGHIPIRKTAGASRGPPGLVDRGR